MFHIPRSNGASRFNPDNPNVNNGPVGAGPNPIPPEFLDAAKEKFKDVFESFNDFGGKYLQQSGKDELGAIIQDLCVGLAHVMKVRHDAPRDVESVQRIATRCFSIFNNENYEKEYQGKLHSGDIQAASRYWEERAKKLVKGNADNKEQKNIVSFAASIWNNLYEEEIRQAKQEKDSNVWPLPSGATVEFVPPDANSPNGKVLVRHELLGAEVELPCKSQEAYRVFKERMQTTNPREASDFKGVLRDLENYCDVVGRKPHFMDAGANEIGIFRRLCEKLPGLTGSQTEGPSVAVLKEPAELNLEALVRGNFKIELKDREERPGQWSRIDLTCERGNFFAKLVDVKDPSPKHFWELPFISSIMGVYGWVAERWNNALKAIHWGGYRLPVFPHYGDKPTEMKFQITDIPCSTLGEDQLFKRVAKLCDLLGKDCIQEGSLSERSILTRSQASADLLLPDSGFKLVYLGNARITDCRWIAANLNFTHFENCTFERCLLAGSMNRTNFVNCDMLDCDIAGDFKNGTVDGGNWDYKTQVAGSWTDIRIKARKFRVDMRQVTDFQGTFFDYRTKADLFRACGSRTPVPFLGIDMPSLYIPVLGLYLSVPGFGHYTKGWFGLKLPSNPKGLTDESLKGMLYDLSSFTSDNYDRRFQFSSEELLSAANKCKMWRTPGEIESIPADEGPYDANTRVRIEYGNGKEKVILFAPPGSQRKRDEWCYLQVFGEDGRGLPAERLRPHQALLRLNEILTKGYSRSSEEGVPHSDELSDELEIDPKGRATTPVTGTDPLAGLVLPAVTTAAASNGTGSTPRSIKL